MAYQTILLQAGIPHRLDIPCSLILIDSVSTAAGVDLQTIDRGGAASVVIPGRKAAFRYTGHFEGVILSAAVATTVSLFLSKTDVQLGVVDGSAVSIPNGVRVTNNDAQAVPVKTPAGQPLEVNFAGTVAPVLGSVAVTNNNAAAIPVTKQKLTVLQDMTVAAINTGAAQLLVSDATLKGLRIRNAHATAIIHIGGSALTAANATIRLAPGDVWTEDDAPGAAWYAISDTNGADVRVMGLK